ncbi:MAG: MOSC domain-containing protein [Actinomycetia bacterium]|nr:MOSC domain-containing protein [Actinomycetes bacterium]
MQRPQVTRLSTTPIKGFGLTHPDAIQLDTNGAVGDRDFFVVNPDADLFSITRTGVFAGWTAIFEPTTSVLSVTSPDGEVFRDDVVEGEGVVVDFWGSRDVTGHLVIGPWSEFLTKIAGQPVSLVRTQAPGAGFDERAVTLVSQESVAELGRLTDTPDIDLRRFRMLIDFSGVDPYEEETWNQQPLTVGSAVLLVRGAVPRCNATTRNPDTGTRDLKTLQLLSQGRGMTPNDFGEDLNMGVYADVLEPGVISVGDELVLSPTT